MQNDPGARAPRRRFLGAGVLLLLGPLAMSREAAAADPIDIAMEGSPDGSRVWFRPRGLLIKPGQTIRWINRDAGNSHTATAYHPSIGSRPRRIPLAAQPWNSGYLLPGESYSVRLDIPGVYDYYCVPHERAGMVGRIIVGAPDTDGIVNDTPGNALPAAAQAGFPSVSRILEERRVR